MGYAAASDLNLKVRDDRLWAGKGENHPLQEPDAAGDLDISARRGFIRGGKWYHCDTMHLESRPDFPESEAACWRRSHAKLISLATKTR
ncbi:M15 family metallopeptidase [Bradyrhizobium elkanii]|uniref:M15 family metallopeptidase n=1 Tax=Bradyrhizobium elkanii TaxID=29448 RepID=UPI002012ADFE|nr:M15 family metallopeptidase [Bradyrhizobium elkanii]